MATSPRDPSSSLSTALRFAWRDHRTYVLFAVGLFVVGTLAGVAGYLVDADIGRQLLDEFAAGLPSEPTVTFILLNNTRVFFLFIVGALTLGLLPGVGLFVNGLLLGYVLSLVAGEAGVLFVVVGIVPHGVLELPALFVAAAVAFRLVHRAVDRVRGVREYVNTRSEWKRTALLVVVAWVALAVAAVVEIYVTGTLLQLLFDNPDAVTGGGNAAGT